VADSMTVCDSDVGVHIHGFSWY